jgi:protein arginine kinase activator
MPVKNLLTSCGIECESKKSKRQIDSAKVCPKCGCTLNHLQTAKSVGCAHCYEAFVGKIAELFKERQFKGKLPRKKNSTVGVVRGRGKSATKPRRTKDISAGEEKIRTFRMHLELAVVEERYEDAARFRDRIATCQRKKSTPYLSKKSLEGGKGKCKNSGCCLKEDNK